MGGMVVAAIDNDERILEGMQALLKQWQCTPICAESSRQSLQRLNAAGLRPETIIADYHLTGEENGLDAIAAMRVVYGAELLAVLITADRSTEVRDRAAAENVYLLHKPVKPASLRALLSQTRMARAAAE
jgi:CheY-like chemotaxis protein